jgi:riboflavin kinase/FMN adenylyltransferase
MVHVGPRPTFDDQEDPPAVEAHLFAEGDPELYGAVLEVTFVSRLRDIQKFADADALVRQLEQDAAAAKQALGQL